jgi:hypothetical protein
VTLLNFHTKLLVAFISLAFVALYTTTSLLSLSTMGANLSKALSELFLLSNTALAQVATRPPVRQQGNETAHARPRCCRQDEYVPPQAAHPFTDLPHSAILYKLKLNQSVTTIPTGRSSSVSPSTLLTLSSRLQCGDGHIQECQIQRLGRWRSRQDPSIVETLLHWDPGSRFRR